MYVSNMDDYAHYNTEYNEFFESQPPVRVCVEALLPKNTPILMEAVAYSVQPGTTFFKSNFYFEILLIY
jgi:enamine deaminase RidA (YjgF/YER057c/UK114 family)